MIRRFLPFLEESLPRTSLGGKSRGELGHGHSMSEIQMVNVLSCISWGPWVGSNCASVAFGSCPLARLHPESSGQMTPFVD